MVSASGTYNIAIAQGEDYYAELTLDNDGAPLDLTDYTFAGQVRASTADVGDPLATFVVAFLDAPNGKISLAIDDTITATLPPQTLVYDLYMTAPGSVRTQILRGKFTVSARVTKS